MDSDRRRQERKVPERLAFFQLERDDGGAVLNISEGGLSFETFSPVQHSELIHFWFSLDLRDRIEAIGELAWTDPSRKVGGLKFLALSRHARERIRVWMNRIPVPAQPSGAPAFVPAPPFLTPGDIENNAQNGARQPGSLMASLLRGQPQSVKEPGRQYISDVPASRQATEPSGHPGSKPSPVTVTLSLEQPVKTEKPKGEYALASVPAFSPSNGRVSSPDTMAPSPLPERRPQPAMFRDYAGSQNSESPAQSEAERFGATELVSLERYHHATRRRFIFGIVLGISISVAAGIAGFKYSRNHAQAAASRAFSPQTAQADADAQAGAPGSSQSGKVPSSIASATGKSQAGSPLGQPVGNPFKPAPAPSRQQSSGSTQKSPLSLASAPLGLGETRGSKKITATPQQLWTAVQAGNAKAAVQLADLYLRGDGVPLNCNQARVLLLVASEKSNTEAIRKLRELDKSGCPTS